ncbi:hypothetical protein HPB48_013031 [Haemaphysalis longicornis]|uniref:Monocarboxylate transporter n=1 Tax=Haemaphysalis longicornis TaxID=44386 RepID=A0A9J6GS14_HAELO|nr:hypothetical protein HPB48_013031 [Haemaphysalis longicornis]
MVAADFTFHLFTATIVDYARDKGLSLNGAAQLVTCACAGGLCGHLFLPLVAHKLVSSRSTTASVSFAVVSLCFFVMPSLTGFVSVSIVTFVSGAQQGYIRTLRAVLVADYLGADYVAMSWGIMGFAALPLIFCEPTIVGECIRHTVFLCLVKQSKPNTGVAAGIKVTKAVRRTFPSVSFALPKP